MFTIRFNSHQSDDQYKSYACRAYFIKHSGDGEATVRMQFPDGEFYEEQVGSMAPWHVAYVTNSESRTIDVIRELKCLGNESTVNEST